MPNDTTERYVIEKVTHFYVKDTQADGHAYLYDGSNEDEANAMLTNLSEMDDLRTANAEKLAAGEPLTVELEDTLDIADKN